MIPRKETDTSCEVETFWTNTPVKGVHVVGAESVGDDLTSALQPMNAKNQLFGFRALLRSQGPRRENQLPGWFSWPALIVSGGWPGVGRIRTVHMDSLLRGVPAWTLTSCSPLTRHLQPLQPWDSRAR